MSYIVYHIKSTVAMRKFFALESAARRSCTCMNRNAGSQQYAYADDNTYYNQVVKTKKVKNLMTDKEIEIARI